MGHTNALICEDVVVVLPGKLGFDITTGGQALASFDDLQIWDFMEINVTWGVEVLFSDEDALYDISMPTDTCDSALG